MSTTPTAGEGAASSGARAQSTPLTVVLASQAEMPGALLSVAGLSVFERLLKQELRSGHQVVVLTDGAFPVPWALASQVATVPLAGIDPAEEAQRRGAPALLHANVVRPGGDRPPLVVTDERTRREAEAAVFRALLRPDLGWVARHLNKPVSFWVTRRLLCRSPLRPNHVTLLAGLLGLLGCWILSHGGRIGVAFGLLLVHGQSVLDGCDGELARVRFQQSAVGEWLDTIVDEVLNFSILVSVGAALRGAGHPVAAALAWVGAAMLVFYDAVAYRELWRQGEGGEILKVRWWFAGGRSIKEQVGHVEGGKLKRIVLVLGRRDFFVFAWFVLGLLGLLPVVALWGFLLAVCYFIAAVGQLVRRPSASV